MAKIRVTVTVGDHRLRFVIHRHRRRTTSETVNLPLPSVADQPMTREEALAMRGAYATLEVPEDQRPRGCE
jgi:hypothetical protein